MTDSFSGANLDPEYVEKKIRSLRNREPFDYESVTDITRVPYWVKLAIARIEVTGCSADDALLGIGRRLNPKTKRPKGRSTLAKYKRSPAVKEYVEELRKQIKNRTPSEIVSDTVQGVLTGAVLDKISALEMAKSAMDYVMVDKIATSLLAIGGITEKKKDIDARPTIVLQLAGGEEIATVKSEAKRLAPPAVVDYEIVED